MSSLTIRDIARMAGVSTTAVSFVLNNRSGVSDATRQKVQEIIQTTGFTPNVHTRRLNLGRSFTVQVVLRQYTQNLYNQFVMETLNGMFKASKALGYSIMFTFVDEDMSCEQMIEAVRSKDCDGVILNQISDPDIIGLLRKEEIPFVCVDAHVKQDGSVPMIEVDYRDAAYQATAYLLSCGHTQVGFLGTDDPSPYFESTLGGFTAALQSQGITCNPDWIWTFPYTEPAAQFHIDRILRQTSLPSAILCAGDPYAVDLVRLAKLHGLRIPEDISIISLDDLLVSRYLDPPLSSMTFDKAQLGEQAMHLLHQMIQKEAYEPIHLTKATVLTRSSVENRA